MLDDAIEVTDCLSVLWRAVTGTSKSMPNANTVAIGAILNNGNGSNSGHVRVYAWNGSSWVQRGLDINGEAASDQSGYSVSMPTKTTVTIGAPQNDDTATSAGHVRVYNFCTCP